MILDNVRVQRVAGVANDLINLGNDTIIHNLPHAFNVGSNNVL